MGTPTLVARINNLFTPYLSLLKLKISTMRLFIIGLFLLGFHALAYAQDEGCYTPRRQKGIEAFDAKDFDKAIKRWQAVLENCTDIPNNHDLNAWIAKAEAAKKPAPSTLLSFPEGQTRDCEPARQR